MAEYCIDLSSMYIEAKSEDEAYEKAKAKINEGYYPDIVGIEVA